MTMLTEEQLTITEHWIDISNHVTPDFDRRIISEHRQLTAQVAALTAKNTDLEVHLNSKYDECEEAQMQEAYAKEQNAALQAERDELQATCDLMSAAGHRASLLWKEQHPDQDIWPDQAENMVWLMERVDAQMDETEKTSAKCIELRHERDAARKALWEVYMLDSVELSPETRGQLDIIAFEKALRG